LTDTELLRSALTGYNVIAYIQIYYEIVYDNISKDINYFNQPYIRLYLLKHKIIDNPFNCYL